MYRENEHVVFLNWVKKLRALHSQIFTEYLC